MSVINKNLLLALLASLITLTLAQTVRARPIEGSVSISQFGQPSKETTERARAEAFADFREELRRWLRESMRIELDTANTVKRFALHKLAERCLKIAEEKTVTKGRVWTLSLSISEDGVRNALRAHNDHYGSQADQHFRSASADDDDPSAALPGVMSALCAAMAKIEPAGAGGGNIQEIRAAAQALLDKMTVKIDGTVIEGRPGSLQQKYPSVALTLDGKPLADFRFTAFVQNGRQFARIATDSQGGFSLKGYKTPFVHNTSMLTVSPDARAFMKADHFIRYKDLGVKLTKGQDMSFIFKVPALTYTLDYKATTLDKSIAIPPDFSSDAHVRKYLKEFCGLTPASSGAAADLAIRISAEFSKVSYEDTEEDAIQMKATAEFRGGNVDKSDKTLFDRRQKYGMSFQMGEYFWAASAALRELIANTLSKDY